MGTICGANNSTDNTEPASSSQTRITIEQCDLYGNGLYNIIANATRDLVLLDLRSSAKYKQGHIDRSINVDISAMTKTDENQIGLELGKHIKEKTISTHTLYLLYDENESQETIEKTNRWFQLIVIPTIENISSWCRFRHIYYCAIYKELVEKFPFVLAKQETKVSDAPSEDEKHADAVSPYIRKPLMGFPSCILPDRLYLGNANHAKDGETLKALGITHVVNVTSEVQNHFEDDGIKYLKFEIDDNPSLNIAQFFDRAIQFIDDALSEQQNRVFVHCQAGISRSGSVVVAYIMTRHNKPVYEEALAFVQQRRPIVFPNRGFVEQLKEYQKSLSQN